MKSNISSTEKKRGFTGSGILLHDFKNVLRQSWILMLTGIVVFTVLFPVSTSAVSEISIFNVEYTHQQLKFRFCAGEVLLVIQAAAVIFGAACGMRLFSFLTDKNKTSFYMSLGLKRRKLFFSRLAAGVIMVAISVAIPMTVSVILNYAALGGYEGMLSYAVYLCAGLIVQITAVMLIAAAACSIAGTFAEASVLGLTIAAAPTAAFYFINVLMKTFLWGNVFGETTYAMATIESGLVEKFSPANPLTFFYSSLTKYYAFSREMSSSEPEPAAVGPLILWILAVIVFAAVVCVLFCRRKAEHAGISGLSRVCNFLVPLVWPFGVFAAVLDAMKDVSRGLAAVGGYFCFFFVFAVLSGVMPGRGGNLFKRAGYGVCLACIVGISILITDMGMFGYTSRIPEAADIASASVTYVGQPAILPAAAQSSSSGTSWYCDAQISFTEDESIQRIREIHEIFADGGQLRFGTYGSADNSGASGSGGSDDNSGAAGSGGSADRSGDNSGASGVSGSDSSVDRSGASGVSGISENKTDFSDTVIPYDIRIDYTLKSGKTIRRYYDRAALWQLAELLKIEDSGEFRSAASSVIQGQLAQTLWNSEAFAAGNIYLADPYLSDISEIKLGENKRAQLLAAIASDMTAQSVEDRYFPEKDTVARLFFTLNGESDLETFGCNASNASVWLTSSYKETAALLSEWGVDVGIDGTGEMEHAESLGGIRQPEMEHAESLGDVQQPEMEHTESLGDVQQPEMEHAEILSDVQQPEIESITLQKFDPYASMNQISDPMSVLFLSYRSASDDDFPIQQDFGTRPQLTDSNQISEIAPALRSTYFMSGGGYIAAVKLSGSDQYIYKFLPYESAPDFINQKMQ